MTIKINQGAASQLPGNRNQLELIYKKNIKNFLL
jgi:hypothetical protein